MDYILLVIGFVLLIKGADYFVDGSSSLAKLLKIPAVIIGLTIVAMGTSAPEAAVSITAGMQGSNGIAISNVVGSNIFNSLVVVGVCGAMMAFQTSKDILKRDLPINALITILLIGMFMDGVLSRLEGILLLVGMVIYIAMMVKAALKSREEDAGDEIESMPLSKCFLFIILGIIAIIGGGQLVVNSAKAIAYSFGWSETFVGLTIVAVGTSLPELVTSIVATRKGESGLALGNAVGSNIFNILFILGMSATLTPIVIDPVAVYDAIVLLGVAILTYIFAKTNQKVSRTEGLIMVITYVVYTCYLLVR